MNSGSELSIEDWKLIADEAIENGMIFASISGGKCNRYSCYDGNKARFYCGYPDCGYSAEFSGTIEHIDPSKQGQGQ